MHNNSYENVFNLHVNEISFSYERMSTKTRFEKEAKGNSEMTYSDTKLNATTDNKQLLDEVFVISRIIKVKVRVISLSLRLITLTETLIILDITKTKSSNKYCFIIH